MKPKPPTATFWALSGIFALSALLPLPGSDGRIAHLPSVCPFYALTGLPCPGCGLTRAFVCLGHGQIAQSLHWHPLGIAVYAACIFVWAAQGWEAWRGMPIGWLRGKSAGRWATASLALLLLCGLLRMGEIALRHTRWPS